ncbi:MAG: peptidylprolyl isomerase [Actinobacteria bacterium HGW-Actinobacteria-4]|nr:MAG: peptidylprolyl isomerase [Actinobacteria bacterium HGW-Actinobacteria-4]
MLNLSKKAAVLGALAALVLAGCSDAEGTNEATGATAGTDADIAAIAGVTWTQNDAGLPELEFEGPINVSATVGRVVADGDGDVVELGDSITIDYVVVDGLDGAPVYSTYTAGTPETLTVSEEMLDPLLVELLVGLRVGASLIYAAVDPAGAVDGGIAQTIVMAVSVQSTTTVLARAEGAPVEPAADLPAVTLAESGAPSLTPVDAEPPAGLVVQRLIEGEGSPVAAGATITAHYTGWLWNGEQFDSSWDRGAPFSIALSPGAVIDGWSQGLVGHPIGSQVLLVIPAELGYGDVGSGSIPPGATLIFVVDILAAG